MGAHITSDNLLGEASRLSADWTLPFQSPVAETELPIDSLAKSVLGYITHRYPDHSWWQGARSMSYLLFMVQDWHIVGLCDACGQMSQWPFFPPLFGLCFTSRRDWKETSCFPSWLRRALV